MTEHEHKPAEDGRRPRYGFNKAGMPIFQLRTHVIEAVCWDGNNRWKTCTTIVSSSKY